VEVVDIEILIGILVQIGTTFRLKDADDPGEREEQHRVRLQPEDGVESREPAELVEQSWYHPRHHRHRCQR
jgi:hypothetical protein